MVIFKKLRDRTSCVHCSCSRSCRVKYLIGDCLAFRHAIADYLVSAVYTCRYSRYVHTIKYFFCVCTVYNVNSYLAFIYKIRKKTGSFLEIYNGWTLIIQSNCMGRCQMLQVRCCYHNLCHSGVGST